MREMSDWLQEAMQLAACFEKVNRFNKSCLILQLYISMNHEKCQ